MYTIGPINHGLPYQKGLSCPVACCTVRTSVVCSFTSFANGCFEEGFWNFPDLTAEVFFFFLSFFTYKVIENTG